MIVRLTEVLKTMFKICFKKVIYIVNNVGTVLSVRHFQSIWHVWFRDTEIYLYWFFFWHCGVCSLALLLIGAEEYNFLNFYSAFYKCFGSSSFSTLYSTKGYTRNLLNLDSLNSKALWKERFGCNSLSRWKTWCTSWNECDIVFYHLNLR